MLNLVLQHIRQKCPKCQRPLIVHYTKQLAMCPACHKHGQNATALLIQSGMTFPQAEQFINRQKVERQTTQGNGVAA